MSSSVLVVDDDPNLVRLMSKFLTLEGFAPVPAANGAEALKYLRGGGRASVILLDLRMPVMDGWTFRREQRGDPGLADIPIVVLSGSRCEGVQEMDAGGLVPQTGQLPRSRRRRAASLRAGSIGCGAFASSADATPAADSDGTWVTLTCEPASGSDRRRRQGTRQGRRRKSRRSTRSSC